MALSERAQRLRDATPEEAELDDLVACLDADDDHERVVALEALGRLALAGRDVSPAVESIDLRTWDADMFEHSLSLTPGPSDEEAILPRAVAFAVCALVLTDHVPETALRELLAVHERQYPSFDAEGRTYTAVREVGWALASAIIVDADHLDALLALADHDDELVRRVAAAGLSDVAEEYRSVHEEPVPRRPELVAHAAELVAGSGNERVRYRAGFTLFEFAIERRAVVRDRIPLLRDALGDDYYLVRKEAAGVLGVLGADEAVDDLERLAESDPTEDVREAAERALGRIDDD